MSPPLPTALQLRQAVRIFMDHAYKDAAVPPSVTQRMAPLNTAPEASPVQPQWFETQLQNNRTSYVLRLGHRTYPHMKLVLEESPDGTAYFFRADAHDRHLHAPQGSADAKALEELRRFNLHLVEAIEHAWAHAQIPTFREYLRQAVQRATHAPGSAKERM